MDALLFHQRFPCQAKQDVSRTFPHALRGGRRALVSNAQYVCSSVSFSALFSISPSLAIHRAAQNCTFLSNRKADISHLSSCPHVFSVWCAILFVTIIHVTRVVRFILRFRFQLEIRFRVETYGTTANGIEKMHKPKAQNDDIILDLKTINADFSTVLLLMANNDSLIGICIIIAVSHY